MSFLDRFEQFAVSFADTAWGTPLLVLLLGGGIFFLLYSRFVPYRHFGHALEILTGKYEDPTAPGDISHFQALSSALAATVGMGNIGGVAIAIVNVVDGMFAMTEYRVQRTEDRKQRTGYREQRTEYRVQITEDRKQKTDE